MLAAAPAAWAQQTAAVKHVAVTAIVQHPALDSFRDGIKQELDASGYKEGVNLKWEYQSAQGNPGIAASIARKFVGDGADVIVPITTPSAQAVVAATRSIPVVYCAVTDPVAAQLVKDLSPSGTNITGVSDRLPLDKQIDLILRIVPRAKRVGMVYNPGEANSAVVVNELKALLAARGMELVESTAPRTIDITAAARNLVGKVDVIYTTTDNNVVSAYEALVKVANDNKIALIAADVDSVKRGAIAALGMDNHLLGRQTGKIVVRILKGEKPGNIPSEIATAVQLFVNTKAARQQGVTLSAALIESAAQVVR
ncbi:MAG: ABC transporter substrate-binding protein [Burkholderiaceae bacterium]|nr:ABC transporter substrate-binding protein [Burkholderiaceae bacterium]